MGALEVGAGAADKGRMRPVIVATVISLVLAACSPNPVATTNPTLQLPAIPQATATIPPSTAASVAGETPAAAGPAPPDLIGWLDSGARPPSDLAGWEGIAAWEVVSGQRAVDEAQTLLAGRPGIGDRLSPENVPTTLRVWLVHPVYQQEVSTRLAEQAGVVRVTTSQEWDLRCDPVFQDWSVVVWVAEELALTRVHGVLTTAPGVESVEFLGPERVLAEYQAMFPDPIGSLAGVEDMPYSARAVAPDAALDELTLELRVLPSVLGVIVPDGCEQ